MEATEKDLIVVVDGMHTCVSCGGTGAAAADVQHKISVGEPWGHGCLGRLVRAKAAQEPMGAQ